jgi:phosphatidylserine decarboxylase
MGRFLLGSTIVMLFPKNTLGFSEEWEAARPVRLGEALGESHGQKTHINLGMPDDLAR